MQAGRWYGVLIRSGFHMTATSARKETVAIVGTGSIGAPWARLKCRRNEPAINELDVPS
jgi:lactate dehydrogenase-like 2-hydroxyacid dehydrogenase